MLLPRQPICHLSFANSSKQLGYQSPSAENSKIINSNRSQVTVKSYQINPTPISLNKPDQQIVNQLQNKQNQQSNYIKIQGSTFKDYAKMQASRRCALSPMPRLIQYRQYKKSLTPGHKSRDQSDKETLKEGTTTLYGTLNSSKNIQNFSSKATLTNLQGSSSFKDLIQNQCRSPLRSHQTNGNMQNKNRIYDGNVKQSLNVLPVLQKKIVQSQEKTLFCLNNDGNTAKYQVVNQEEDGDQLLFYCSKCTIPLVQQGFIVEEIKTTSPSTNTHIQDYVKRIDQYRIKLREKKSINENIKVQIINRQSQAIESIKKYYEKILSYIQSQRQLDIDLVQKYYSSSKSSCNQILTQITSHLERLHNNLNSPQRKIQASQIQALLLKKQDFSKQIILQSFQNANFVSRFSKYFQQHLKPNFLPQNKNTEQQQDLQNQNNALRFSFEQPLSSRCQNTNTSTLMNTLEEEQNEQDNQTNAVQQLNHQYSAFRTLFPSHSPDNTNKPTLSPTFKNI